MSTAATEQTLATGTCRRLLSLARLARSTKLGAASHSTARPSLEAFPRGRCLLPGLLGCSGAKAEDTWPDSDSASRGFFFNSSLGTFRAFSVCVAF